MLLQAILIGLVAMCSTFEWALGTCLASRPIVTGVFRLISDLSRTR